MLMDLLGSSLEDLFAESGKRLTLRTVLQLGEQILDRIEFMHEKNILHRDIKPDNFLMGAGKNAHLVYIVDFGLSKKFIQESKTLIYADKHIPYKEGKELTGTARYASINTHMGIEQSRRDDIESIGYVLMYLLRGILPWMSMKAKDTKTKYKMIMEKKISTPAEFLTKGFPNELALFINYAKGLKFEEKPDYKYLKGLLTTARKNNKIEMDGVYDWTIKTTVNNIGLDIPSQKVEVVRPKEEKFEHVKNRKE
jgi:serine/threonine protein kinase